MEYSSDIFDDMRNMVLAAVDKDDIKNCDLFQHLNQVSVQLEQSFGNGVDIFVTVTCETYDKVIISYINAIPEFLVTLFRNVGADIGISMSPYMEIEAESRYYTINFTYPIRIDKWHLFDKYKVAIENEERILAEERRIAQECQRLIELTIKKEKLIQTELDRQERYNQYLHLKQEFDK